MHPKKYFGNSVTDLSKQMTEVLKVTPTPIETMIMDTAKALVNLKIVKAKQRNLDPGKAFLMLACFCCFRMF